MQKIKILLTKHFFTEDIKYMENRLGNDFVFIDTRDYTEKGLLSVAKEANVFLGPFVSEELLTNAEKLKLIQIPWTGVDKLNYEVLSKFNIPICNSHSNSRCVAEYAFAMLMSLIKKIPYHDRLLREGNWNRPQEGIIQECNSYSNTLFNKTVAFLGYGKIAKKVSEYLKPFNCNIIAVTNYGNKKYYQELSFKGTPDDIDYVLSKADFVFITLPYTQFTKDLVNKDKIEKMKNTAYLINISRGAIVNEHSLYEALRTKRILGAAIDVWYKYPAKGATQLPSRYPFQELPNIVMSSHRAGFLLGELPHLDDAIENIKRLAKGMELINRIDITRKY